MRKRFGYTRETVITIDNFKENESEELNHVKLIKLKY